MLYEFSNKNVNIKKINYVDKTKVNFFLFSRMIWDKGIKEYIDAAICLAIPRSRIISRHLLPNSIAPLIVVGAIQMAHAIALEATLSFLGIGLAITEPSLGLLIANGFEYMLSGKYWISLFPGIALLITIFSINLVGDQLRDVLNPRLQR